MTSKAEKLLSRGRFQKFLMNQEDAGVIAGMNLELDHIVQAFMVRSNPSYRKGKIDNRNVYLA